MELLRYFVAVAPAASKALAYEARTSATIIFGYLIIQGMQTFTDENQVLLCHFIEF